MEAKDTVMTGKQIDAEMDRIEKLDTSYTTAEIELCKAQAQISFEAGKQEERKKLASLLSKIACELDANQSYKRFYNAIHQLYHDFTKDWE